MKTAAFFLLFISTVFFLNAQHYTQLGTDTSGDNIIPNGLDLKSLEVATDTVKDSIWIKVTCHNKIKEDWGMTLLFDTNSVATDGKYWIAKNKGANNDLSYEKQLEILNNQFFPPTIATLADTSGMNVVQDIGLNHPDSFTLVIKFELKHIGSDGRFNIMLGGGSFDGQVYDNQPNTGFYSYEHKDPIQTTLHTVTNQDAVSIFPQPAYNKLHLSSPEPLSQITLYNTIGTTVFSTNISNQYESSIDLSNLVPGLYIVRLQTLSNKKIIKTIIKQ